MGIVEGTKASDGESSFAVDVEQWSLLSAFGSEAPSLTTDGSVCQSATSTNYSVDMAFWNDAFTIPPAAKTRNIVTTPQSRATLGGSSSTDPNTTSSQSQTENQPDPGPEIETETQTQANTRVERLAGGSGLTQWTEQKPCSCIQRIVLLINELETGINNMDDHDYNQAGGDGLLHNRRGLDSALGLHKETLHYGQSMRQCRQCSYRTETGLLLLLLVNRLVVLCANMVSTYLNASQSPVLSHELSITVGDYEVDSDVERGAVMREIVAFQLRALHSFIISLPDARHPPAADQIGAKNKVESLLQRLHMRSVAFPSP
ncbi:hypothetical protein EV356DRAFT_537619 [Viridothelium virens]|uniref:Aflatoxin regulatory protein domain-containing protein n=1 Tax=Viridothelium virens TaxID=1048519 RepID=A0A6A6GT69_VIRVR|nr:hypothetical protein EV356DRAFT_537619 [Viridothelium virens]